MAFSGITAIGEGACGRIDYGELLTSRTLGEKHFSRRSVQTGAGLDTRGAALERRVT
jgi:hypothetical protein